MVADSDEMSPENMRGAAAKEVGAEDSWQKGWASQNHQAPAGREGG